MHFLPNQIEIHQDPVATIRRGELVLEKSGEEEFRGGGEILGLSQGETRCRRTLWYIMNLKFRSDQFNLFF